MPTSKNLWAWFALHFPLQMIIEFEINSSYIVLIYVHEQMKKFLSDNIALKIIGIVDFTIKLAFWWLNVLI